MFYVHKQTYWCYFRLDCNLNSELCNWTQGNWDYAPRNKRPSINFILDCDFDSDFCNWRQGNGDDFDWVIFKGSSLTLETGPLDDHSEGTNF